MKIVKLSAENFKKLRAVEITPTGDLVQVTGRNGAGKSSILDAIWAALGGAKHIQAVPIRKGTDKARIRLDLGELIVERRFTSASSTLVVENAEGARFTSPQTMLDALLGALTFDPLAFVQQPPREQFETLRRIVTLDVDPDQLDGLNRRDFDRRAEVNREAKQMRAQADGLTVPDGLPDAAIDTAAIKDRMAEAGKSNTDTVARRGRREQAARDVSERTRQAEAKRAEATELRRRAQDADEEAVRIEASATELQQKLDEAAPMPELVDVDAIRTELDQAETANRGVEQRVRKINLLTRAVALEEQARELTATMDARTGAKIEAVARAAMPVPGLSFGEGIVTFGGMPFDQASSAEQLRVSVAIAMAANPKLRVIRIQEGSLLDADNLALIAEMARARDYQVWVERVDTSGKIGVVIEDGQVVAVDGEPVPAAGAQA